MSYTSEIILSLVSVLVFAWPTWAALIVAQVVTLATGVEEFRWLPGGLLLIGFGYASVRPLLH